MVVVVVEHGGKQIPLLFGATINISPGTALGGETTLSQWSSRRVIGYEIQSPWYVSGFQDDLVVAPDKNSSQQGTQGV